MSPSRIGQSRSFDPPGGGASAAARDSTTSSAAATVSPSTSRPAVLYPTELTCVPSRSQSRRTTGSALCVHAQTTSAARTASANDAALAAMPVSAAIWRASAEALAMSRAPTTISRKGRTRGSARRCARACTPAPSTARVAASRRASRSVASAEPAAVRAAVIASPSISAAGDPVSGSNATITAWCVGRSVLRGKSDTSFVVRAPAPGRYAGMTARSPSRSGTSAAMRVGIEARPAERSASAAATAARSASGSRRDSTSRLSRTSIRGC